MSNLIKKSWTDFSSYIMPTSLFYYILLHITNIKCLSILTARLFGPALLFDTLESHWLYRILDDKKKLAASNSVFQAFEGFIERSNKEKISIPVRAFLENPLFVLFTAYILDLVDPGACYGYFVLLPFSECFKRMLLFKKVFKFHDRVQKCHFGKIEKLPKWHF